MRFWLTAKDLGLPGLTNRWKTIASLKGERLVKTMVRTS
jgi:hypothetical protein